MGKIGLCLAGGGARGPYQIGVAKALEEIGLFERISAFSGTSIGSVNAAFLATVGVAHSETLWAGISDDEIKTTEGTFKRLIKEGFHIAEKGVYDISALRSYLSNNLDYEALKNREVYVTVSEGGPADESILGLIKSSIKHYFRKDSKVHYVPLAPFSKEEINDLIIASCSIPVVFPPVIRKGIKYYDGGVYDNIPVEPLIHSGCDTIIVAHLLLINFIDKAKYPGINFIEIRHSSMLGGVLNFSPNRVKTLVDLGYKDTMNYFNTHFFHN